MEDELMHYGRKGMKWYQHIFGERQDKAKYAQREVAQIKTLTRMQESSNKEHERKFNMMKRPRSKASINDAIELSDEYFERLSILGKLQFDKIENLKGFYEGREALRKLFEGNDWYYDTYPVAIKRVGHEKIDAVRRALSGKK